MLIYITARNKTQIKVKKVIAMRTLRVFKLTDDAENRGIDWNNFDDTDIETVEEIEVEDEEADAMAVDEIMYEYGFDSDMYGAEWL